MGQKEDKIIEAPSNQSRVVATIAKKLHNIHIIRILLLLLLLLTGQTAMLICPGDQPNCYNNH